MPENAFTRQGMLGSYPEKENEICVSTYFADMIVECKTIAQDGSVVSITDRTQLIGKTVLLDGNACKVTGIFDSGVIDAKYDALKDNTAQDYSLKRDFESLLGNGMHQLVGVSEKGLEWFNQHSGNGGMYSGDSNRWGNAYVSDGTAEPEGDEMMKEEYGDGTIGFIQYGSTAYYTPFSSLGGQSYISLVDGKTTLSDNEAIVPFGMLADAVRNRIYVAQDAVREKVYGLENYVWEIDNVRYSIEYAEGELTNYEDRIAQIEIAIQQIVDQLLADLDLSDVNEINDDQYPYEYWEYQNELNQCLSAKADYESNLQFYQDEIVRLVSEIPAEYGVTAENYQEKLADLNAQVAAFDKLVSDLDVIRYGYQSVYEEDKGEYTDTYYSLEERVELLQKFLEKNSAYVEGLTLNFYLTNQMQQTPMTETTAYTIAGVVILENEEDYYASNTVWFTDKVVDEYWTLQKAGTSYSEYTTNYQDAPDAIYTKVYVPYDHSDAQTNYLWGVYATEGYAEDDSKIGLVGDYVDSLQTVDTFVTELSTIFLYIGLVLAAFAILLFSNFISVSISQKRREIGILRAVGARSVDVFKIFFSESLVIAVICSALSIVGSAVVCQLLNAEVGTSMGASIFVFGLTSVLIICAIAVLTALLATFLPVRNAAKKKPVDSIRAI